MHEPHTACIAKGKAGKPYEFGSKVVFVRGAKSGVITAACNFSGNPHDGKTPRRDAFPRESFGLALEATLAQSQRVCNGHRAKVAVTDRGFRGQSKVVDTQIVIPDSPAKIKRQTAYQKRKARPRGCPSHATGIPLGKGCLWHGEGMPCGMGLWNKLYYTF